MLTITAATNLFSGCYSLSHNSFAGFSSAKGLDHRFAPGTEEIWMVCRWLPTVVSNGSLSWCG
jgi:hypothetical protein